MQRLRGLVVEDVELVFQHLGRGAVAHGDVVHRRDEVGDARHQRALQRVEVVVRASQDFLQQDVALAQPLEQRDRVGAQDLAGLLHLGHGGDRDLARLLDRRREACSRSFSDLLIALVANSPADVIVRATSEPLPIIDCAKAWPRVSIDLSASEVTRSTSTVSWLVLAPSGFDQRAALGVDHLRQPVGLLLHIVDDLIGLAGHGGAEARCRRRAPSARFRTLAERLRSMRPTRSGAERVWMLVVLAVTVPASARSRRTP